MLRVKSFPITDDAGINDLLLKYRLAKDAHILVSDGHVCIPFEDGQPMNADQHKVLLGEEKSTLMQQADIINHSQAVLDALMADAQERVNFAQSNVSADENSDTYVEADVKKEHKGKLDEAQNAYNQLDNQKKLNAAELIRLDINMQKFDEAKAALSA